MFDERSPIMRRAMSPYQDSMAGFVAALENRSAEFKAKLAKLAEESAERDRQLREKVSTMGVELPTKVAQRPLPEDDLMEFGGDEERGRPPVDPPTRPVPEQPVAQQAPVRTPRLRRRADDEEDYSTQDWLDGS